MPPPANVVFPESRSPTTRWDFGLQRETLAFGSLGEKISAAHVWGTAFLLAKRCFFRAQKLRAFWFRQFRQSIFRLNP